MVESFVDRLTAPHLVAPRPAHRHPACASSLVSCLLMTRWSATPLRHSPCSITACIYKRASKPGRYFRAPITVTPRSSPQRFRYAHLHPYFAPCTFERCA